MTHPEEKSIPRTPDWEAQFWRELGRLRGTLDLASLRNLVLALVFLRSTDEAGWEASRSSGYSDAQWRYVEGQLRDISYRFPGEARTALAPLPDLPRFALDRLLDLIENLAARYGNAAAFRYLLREFAERDGLRGGEFYTPEAITNIMAQLIITEPVSSIADPACRSGELLMEAASRAREGARSSAPYVYGTALNSESLVIAQMNAQLNGIEGDFKLRPAAEIFYDYEGEGPNPDDSCGRMTGPGSRLSR